jgi:hypothetical protein
MKPTRFQQIENLVAKKTDDHKKERQENGSPDLNTVRKPEIQIS